MNEEEMKQLLEEVIKATASHQAKKVKDEIASVLGADGVGELLSNWDEENPGYFDVLADDPSKLSAQLKKHKINKETEHELERRKREGGEEVIRKVKETLKRAERLKQPLELGRKLRQNEGKNSRLLNNILYTLNN
jgi:hypothetical protein